MGRSREPMAKSARRAERGNLVFIQVFIQLISPSSGSKAKNVTSYENTP
jgi:hypothetical protein